MAMVPVMLFGPAAKKLISRLLFCHGAPTRLRLRVPRKGICLLVAFVMLLGPEGFNSLARAEVQYANLGTSSWGQANRTIHYSYDANGSLEKKIIAVTGEADPDNNYIEKFIYSYNLANRFETITHYSYEDLGGSTDDDHIEEVTTYIYNDDGIRVAAEYQRSVDYYPFDETFDLYDQHSTTYLVDSYNHTGYAQTLEESKNITYENGSPVSSSHLTTYLIGDDVIAQTIDGATQYLLYDGHGSTRQLADSIGSLITNESYSYDAYGVLLGGPRATQTDLLYTGEMYDSGAEMYYLRARYYDPLNGRFNRMDPFAGNNQDPQSLHKYLYVHNNPVNGIDPSGEFTITNVTVSMAITAAAIALPALNMAAMTLFALPGEDEDSSGYVASITLSGTVLNAGGWPGLAGVGGELSNEFLYIKSKGRWYDYFAGGLMVGLLGYSLSVEAGPVYRVEEVKDYTGLYLTTSFGGTKGIFGPFAGLYSRAGISPGMSGALFWSPLGKRSYGYKVGGMFSSSSAVWGFTAAWYFAVDFKGISIKSTLKWEAWAKEDRSKAKGC